MKNNQFDIKSIREMFKNMSLSNRNEVINSINQEKDRLGKVEERRTTFIQLVKEWGYTSPTEFLIEGEFIPNPTAKRPRTHIDPITRSKVLERTREGKTTKEISTELGVHRDTVYSIRSTNGLSQKRKPKVTTTVPTPLEVAA